MMPRPGGAGNGKTRRNPRRGSTVGRSGRRCHSCRWTLEGCRMSRWTCCLLLGAVGLLTGAGSDWAQDGPSFERTRDVIYGRKSGMALTMDVFTPKQANGGAVIFVVSGGWFSNPEAINPVIPAEFLRRGYTVFCVCHGSQPKFTIPEIIDDLHRAVRFIRFNAKQFHIDPERIGVTGVSAGGHLSLVLGTSG